MVRLGIVSDSHRTPSQVDRFIQLANRQRYDGVFHLGDGEGDAKQMERQLSMPLYCVAGNCDWGLKLHQELVVAFEGIRILAAHGHRYDVKWELDRLSYRAEELGAQVALYGHTHIPNAEYRGPVLMVNPGALMRGCYGELIIENGRAKPYLKDLGG